METGIQIFNNKRFGKVRIVMRDNEPWFVARDVALALGYADPADAVQRHCKKVNDSNMGVSPTVPSPKIIPESDVYRLVMRSNLPGVDEFQDWVVEDVLPTIRKTGSYSMPTAPAKAEISVQSELECAMLILKAAGISGNQLALAADNYYRSRTGVSALELSGTQLVAPQQEQLLTPTQLGQLMGGLSGKKVNQRLIDEGFQIRLPSGQLEPTAKGSEAGGVLMDTSKRHSDGTPVRQLKWPSSMAGKIASAA